MNDFIKIKKSLENSNVSIDSITKTVKYKIKKQEYRFLPTLLTSLVASLMWPVIFSVLKVISGRGVRRAWRGCKDKNFYFCIILKAILKLINVSITS